MQARELLERYQQGERDFSHIDLSGTSLSGANLRDIDLTGANLTGANLSWAFLNRAKLTGACLRRADLRSLSLNSADLTQANLSGANLGKADLRLSQLQGADLNWAILQEADLSGANLEKAKLDQVNLERAKLNSTNLVGAELMEANLRRSILTGANLSGANLREAHLEEANLREAKLVGTNLIEANLSGVYLRQADLREADLHRVVLTGADLSEANLASADLSRANLAGAYLLKASFCRAHLLRADLQDVYLLRADLSEANLRGADLRRADLSGAYLSDTILSEANLSDAYLLESRLIRTNLEGAQLTGCCIFNWYIEELDLSKVECRYVFNQFNYTAKSPTDRFPVGRDFKPGELGQQYQENSPIIEIYLTEIPNWQALVFTLAQVELENQDLQLTIKSYEPYDDNFLLKVTASRTINGKLLARRVFQLYPEVLQRVLAQQQQLLSVLEITARNGNVDLSAEVTQIQQATPPPQPSPDRRMRIYQEVVRQIQHILASQAPETFVSSVQHLLDYLKRQNISTEEIQKKIIGQNILQRAKQDTDFQERLLKWEKNAPDNVRLSPVGEAVRIAIALLWSESQKG